MSIVSTKFDNDLIPLITAYEKDATVRYEFNRRIRRGDTLLLKDEDGNQFGRATVTFVAEVIARNAIYTIEKHGGKYPIDSTQKLLSELNRYYDDEITEETRVFVIGFKVQQINRADYG